jgi:hypothetical protein
MDMLESNATVWTDYGTDGFSQEILDDIRRAWTAQQLLQDPALMHRYLPAMTSALSAGGVMAGNNYLEDEQPPGALR